MFFVSDACHEQTIDVQRTRAAPIGIEIVIGDERQGAGRRFHDPAAIPGING